MQSLHLLLFIITVFASLVVDVSRGQQLFEGDECLLGETGFYGECKKSANCRGLIGNIASGHQPTLCSFSQRNAIICCPISRGLTTSATQSARKTTTDAPSSGGTCTQRNGAQGKCKSIQDCPRIYTSIRNNTQPIICGFNQSTPIVCCPLNSPTATTRPPNRTQPKKDEQRRTSTQKSSLTTSSVVGEKSAAMCEYFSQFVYQIVESPTLLLKSDFYNESVCATHEHILGQAPLRDVEETIYREFPHVASLGYGNESSVHWLCGGSLISERFILTTAHCLTSPNNGVVRWARIGDRSPRVNTPDSAEIHTVVERIRHEGYRESSPWQNDIALLKLANDVSFLGGAARPACLYTQADNPPGHGYATAAGWGMTDWNDTTTTTALMKKDLTLVPEGQCSSSRQADSSVVCVTDPSPPSPASCVGDSGGGLQIVLNSPHCMHGIVGLTSFGPRACADATTPASYTRVAHFTAWIETHVWP